jgi:hypothetical protein
MNLGVRPFRRAHFAGKEPQSGTKERAEVQQRVSTTGSRTNARLRQHCPACARARHMSQGSLQLARSTGRDQPSSCANPRANPAQADPQAQAIVGQQNSRSGFFQTSLAKSRSSASTELLSWRQGIYDEIRARVPLQGDLSVERMCQLTQVSRAGFYRYLRAGWQTEEEVALRSAVQAIVMQHRWRYGYRRVTAELRSQGMTVNHKRIARIMRDDHLLTFRDEWQQSASHRNRGVRIYLNLANRYTVQATRG